MQLVPTATGDDNSSEVGSRACERMHSGVCLRSRHLLLTLIICSPRLRDLLRRERQNYFFDTDKRTHNADEELRLRVDIKIAGWNCRSTRRTLADFESTVRHALRWGVREAPKRCQRNRVTKLKRYALAPHGADSLVQEIHKRSDLRRKIPPLGIDNVDVESG